MAEEKTCKTCRYCKRYYVRYRLRFSPADQGECARSKRGTPLQSPFADACAHWEARADDEKVIRKDLAKTAFAAIYERIDELIALLKD